MKAMTKGWTFAEDLDFLEAGDEASKNFQKIP